MLTTAVYYANEMLDGYSAFTLFKVQSKILGLNEFLRFKNVYGLFCQFPARNCENANFYLITQTV